MKTYVQIPNYHYWYDSLRDEWGTRNGQTIVHEYNSDDGMVYESYLDYDYTVHRGLDIPVLHGPAPLHWCITSEYQWCYPLPR